MDKLLIVDGNAVLFQSFFGMPHKIKNSFGKNIEAVICFVSILLKVIKMLKPSQLLIVFDGENELSRQVLDDDYKKNRPSFADVPDEDNPFAQLTLIQQVLKYIEFSYVETTDCEADDLIASVVNKEKHAKEIVIFSPDKDFYQLISNNVAVFTYRGKLSQLFTQQEIQNKYGFDAKYFSTYKSLIGDKSDNIKGISGIGNKTATSLIQQFGYLNNILKNLNSISDKLALKLREQKNKVLTNLEIIDLSNKKENYPQFNLTFTHPNKNANQILKEMNLL